MAAAGDAVWVSGWLCAFLCLCPSALFTQVGEHGIAQSRWRVYMGSVHMIHDGRHRLKTLLVISMSAKALHKLNIFCYVASLFTVYLHAGFQSCSVDMGLGLRLGRVSSGCTCSTPSNESGRPTFLRPTGRPFPTLPGQLMPVLPCRPGASQQIRKAAAQLSASPSTSSMQLPEASILGGSWWDSAGHCGGLGGTVDTVLGIASQFFHMLCWSCCMGPSPNAFSVDG